MLIFVSFSVFSFFFFLVFYTKIVNASLFFVVVIVLFSHVWINGVLNFALMDSNFTFTLCPFFFFLLRFLSLRCLFIYRCFHPIDDSASLESTHTYKCKYKQARKCTYRNVSFFFFCYVTKSRIQARQTKRKPGQEARRRKKTKAVKSEGITGG